MISNVSNFFSDNYIFKKPFRNYGYIFACELKNVKLKEVIQAMEDFPMDFKKVTTQLMP
jgi:hypothetical protein